MRLLYVKVINADTCGGLLDGLAITLRPDHQDPPIFQPVCLIGPNGSGKSQLLQIIAEIFQLLCHEFSPMEERTAANPKLTFHVEYQITPPGSGKRCHIRAKRESHGSRKPVITLEEKTEVEWVRREGQEAQRLLPSKIIGYTSGDNETLSLPFIISRREYADDIGMMALPSRSRKNRIPTSDNTRLMFIDYGTNLAVLASNLLLGSEEQRTELLKHARVDRLRSFRLIIQLKTRTTVKITNELEEYVDFLKRCATCHTYDHKNIQWTFDYLITEETRKAFTAFWPEGQLSLYQSFYKLTMLNDLALSKRTRERARADAKNRRFAARLPEPEEDDKVFRFQEVLFGKRNSPEPVDYVSLSDGEHQMTQILGTMCMASIPGILLLLDEPESHFNPEWRTKFITMISELPTPNGRRRDPGSGSADQDIILTTHAPFVPCDTDAERVFIFSKKSTNSNDAITVRNPHIQTYGSNFDTILQECFHIHPPISEDAKREIDRLLKSNNEEEIQEGLNKIGTTMEKTHVLRHLRRLQATQDH